MKHTAQNIISLFGVSMPLIGVIHLPALPGYKEHIGMKHIIEKALKDLVTLEKAGFQGVLVENDGDHPPHIGPNEAITKHFEEVMKALLKKAKIPVGLEILYDMEGTVKLACKVKANFVRLDVFVDDVKTRYGPVIYGQGEKLNALRKKYHPHLLLLTDIQVKHTTMVDLTKTIQQSAKEAVLAGSDAIIVTGTWTGKEPTGQDIIQVKEAIGDTPLLIGSGFSSTNAKKFFPYISGAIVASSIKKGEYIDGKKARRLYKSVMQLQTHTIVSIGDIGMDWYLNKNLKKPGGIGFNFASHVYTNGVYASLVSVIGNDSDGKKILSLFQKIPLDCSNVHVILGATPTQKIILEKNGERKFVGYNPGVLKKWNLTKRDLQFIGYQDAIFVPLSDGMKHIFETIAFFKTDAIKIADFSQDSEYADFDKKDNIITKYCKYFDINFVSATEKQQKLLLSLSRKYKNKIFVLTLGSKGSLCFFEGKKFFQPAQTINKVVDTTGAGDAFQASFVSSYITNKDIVLSLQKAAKYASDVTQFIGATKYTLESIRSS